MTFSPQTGDHMRHAFKHLNRFMVLMFRLGLGPWLQFWPRVTGQILVLVHRGRKSGLLRRTPLNFARADGDIYILAGFGRASDWYRNLRADRQGEVWLPDGWWSVEAEEVSDHPERLRLLRAVLVGSGFAAYAFGVSPGLPDERLAQITSGYRLVRLRLVGPRTGPGGPGDLAWVWPAALTLRLLLRRRRR
ncbi:MAG: nitroreductase family deazaflavin-dependent oxidoreductase [Acidimicrobiia bacterium]|nr:nitroreductase family deazaflavin-dependent oxidoreductase [Acidimicrobiia bacterium]